MQNKKIVCLGGGIGTSTMLKGLKEYNPQLTVLTSMADDGGSSGRLRKAYNIMPCGDLISCIAALAPDDHKELAALLTYRFNGQDKDNKSIGAQKLGNLIMLAEIQRTGDFYKALDAVKHMCGVKNADIWPATDERTQLSAITTDGRRVHTETALDLAHYAKPYDLKKVYISPKDPQVNQKVIESLIHADVIISGPGDLYTNQLPVLIIPPIKQALLDSKAKKFFILNIANKPFETEEFSLQKYITAITEHLDVFPFDTVIANNNYSEEIPAKYKKYKYIEIEPHLKTPDQSFTLIEDDIINHDAPIYHDPLKLATIVAKQV